MDGGQDAMVYLANTFENFVFDLKGVSSAASNVGENCTPTGHMETKCELESDYVCLYVMVSSIVNGFIIKFVGCARPNLFPYLWLQNSKNFWIQDKFISRNISRRTWFNKQITSYIIFVRRNGWLLEQRVTINSGLCGDLIPLILQTTKILESNSELQKQEVDAKVILVKKSDLLNPVLLLLKILRLT